MIPTGEDSGLYPTGLVTDRVILEVRGEDEDLILRSKTDLARKLVLRIRLEDGSTREVLRLPVFRPDEIDREDDA